MANAFRSYMQAKDQAMRQGANALAMQREQQLRDVMSQAYRPPSPAIAQPAQALQGPTLGGPALGAVPAGQEIPAVAGGMDWQRAMAGAAEQRVIPEMMQMQAGMTRARGAAPSAVREWEYYSQLPQEEQERFLTMKRAAQFQTIGGVPTLIRPGAAPKQLTTLEIEAAAQARIAGEKTAATKAAETQAKRLALEPKARMTGKMVKQQTQFVINTIDKAIGQVSPLTAGPGAMTAGLPGTPAKDLSETLNTIRANIGFDRLQQMRAASPTGGALGQVSEMENKLLQAVWGSLEQSQSPSQLKENLKKAKIAIRESWERTAAAYEKDYGRPMPSEGTPLGEPTTAPQQNIRKIGNKTYINVNGQWFEQ